jgi:hypothetical protein
MQRQPNTENVAPAGAQQSKRGRRPLAPAAELLGPAKVEAVGAAAALSLPAVRLCELPSMLEEVPSEPSMAASPTLASVGLEHAPLSLLTLGRAPRSHPMSLAWSQLVASALPPAADEDEDEAPAPGGGQRAIDRIELCRPGKIASLATALARVGQRIPGHALAYPIGAMLFSDVSAHPPAAGAAHAALRASLASLTAPSLTPQEHAEAQRRAVTVDAPSAHALVPPVAEAVLQRMSPAAVGEDEVVSTSRALRALPLLHFITSFLRAAAATSAPHGDTLELVRGFAGASRTAEAASRCLAHGDARVGAAAAGLLDAIDACIALCEPAHSARGMIPAAISTVFDALPWPACRDRLLRCIHGRAFELPSLARLLDGRTTTKKPLVHTSAAAVPSLLSLLEVLTASPKKEADAAPLLLIQAAFAEAEVERGSLNASTADLRRALAAACGDLSQKCAGCGLHGAAASLDLAGEVFSTS